MAQKAVDVYNLFNFVDFAGGVTLSQRVNVTEAAWVNGMLREVCGGVGTVKGTTAEE